MKVMSKNVGGQNSAYRYASNKKIPAGDLFGYRKTAYLGRICRLKRPGRGRSFAVGGNKIDAFAASELFPDRTEHGEFRAGRGP